MKMEMTRAAVIGLVVLGFILVPSAWLEWWRWGTVLAILAGTAIYYWRRGSAVSEPAPVVRPTGSALSAELLVSFRSTDGRPVDERERQLFRGAIVQCVRSSDQVSEVEAGLYSVLLNNVASDQVERIGRRICEQAANLIVFDDDGSIKQITAIVGGVTSYSGFTQAGHKVAEANLARAESLEGVNVLISAAA
jgi:hypothetical protein